MGENDLRHFQRLGIDIWVSPQQASALIAKGAARSRVRDSNDQKVSQAATAPVQKRTWSTKKRSQRPKTTSRETVEARNHNLATQRTVTRPRENEAKQLPQSFEVSLRVFMYGDVSLIVDTDARCPNSLVSDVLIALSGFELHHLNELHFEFPVRGKNQRSAVPGTLTGAQEALRTWLERVSCCVAFLAIGERATKATAKLPAAKYRFCAMDHVPLSLADKQELWNQIKRLKG